MKTTYNYNFYCRKQKANKKTGEAPIEMTVSLNGERVFIQLPLRCTPEEFSQNPQVVRDFIDTQRVKLRNTILELEEEEAPVTAHSIRERFINGKRKETLETTFNDFLALKKKTLSKSLYHKYEFVKDLFFTYADKDCNNITNAQIRHFCAELERKYENSTALSYFGKLKSLIRYALDNGKLAYNPIQGFKMKKVKKEIDYLTESEIQKLKDTKVDTESLQKVKDCALFQISSGLSYCDCLELKPTDLKEKDGTYYINKCRHKTGTPFFAVVLPDGVEVFQRYQGKLPFISNQKYNLFLKALAERAGINKNFHSHLFRHTYCSTLLNRGVSIKTVSRCAGHTTTAMTEHFYAFLRNETVLDEVSKVI